MLKILSLQPSSRYWIYRMLTREGADIIFGLGPDNFPEILV